METISLFQDKDLSVYFVFHLPFQAIDEFLAGMGMLLNPAFGAGLMMDEHAEKSCPP